MIDELNELRRANPERASDVQRLVAMDRTALISALDADARVRWSPVAPLRRWSRRLAPRFPITVGVAGRVAVTAGVLVALLLVGASDRFADPSVVIVNTGESQTSSTSGAPDPGPGVPTTSPTAGLPPTTVPAGVPDEHQPVPTSEGATSTTGLDVQPPPSTANSEPIVTQAPAPSTSVPSSTTSEEAIVAPPAPPASPSIAGPLDASTDLLVLHFDFAHRDDGHAAMAAQEITTWFGLDPLVVAGTQALESSAFVHPYDQMMEASWPGRWFDAGDDRAAAVNAAADRWLAALDVGGQVWIADAGVSDFSAEVVREVQRRRSDLDLSTRVHIVQHSQRNEDETRPDDLALVFSELSYVRIDDGNGPNGTADLNGSSAGFEAAALAGPRVSGWTAAFEYMSADQLDFSDTVELLHIVGLSTEQVADADDFATFFMGTLPG